jgi:UDP-N-acetylmuramate dehydrogenase
MNISFHTDLRPYNSFHISTTAAGFAAFSNVAMLQELLDMPAAKQFARTMLLGGGSNILFTKPFDGLILKNEIAGIEVVEETDDHVLVKAGGGIVWHHFVMHAVANNWGGVENLSLIPGCVGASPIQNIGAYGVEIKDVLHSLEAYHLKDASLARFTSADCGFGYRDSVFKNKYKGEFAILSVTFQLNKQPRLNTSYGAIEQELERMGISDPTIKEVSAAVINIRQSKLPDPDKIGNAGSFFKNPVISNEQFDEIKKLYPGVPGFAGSEGTTKMPAAWLIEQCGWKGYRHNDAGVHQWQPLVLVNYGKATGKEIFELSERILQSVKQRFGIELEREVNIC